MNSDMPAGAPVVASGADNPTRRLAWTYIISLSLIAGLSIIVHVMLDGVIAQQATNGKFINISGQQRMLSQRTSLFALKYLNSGDVEAKLLAGQALERMQRNHQFLMEDHLQSQSEGRESPFSPAMHALYFDPPFNVDGKLKTYVGMINRALESEPLTSEDPVNRYETDFLQLSRQPLLIAFDYVVQQYEKEGKERIDKLRSAQEVLMAVIVLTVIIEAFFIFRPMVRRVADYQSRLGFKNSNELLPGLLNGQAFQVVAEQLFSGTRRYSQSLSVVALGIDELAQIVDAHGPEAGNDTVEWVAGLIKKNVSESDYVARVSESEFVVVMPKKGADSARNVAEKIRRVIEMSPISTYESSVKITISAGVSAVLDVDDHFDLVRGRAVKALRRAQLAGSNRVVCYLEPR